MRQVCSILKYRYMSQVELSILLQVHQPTISNYRHGRRHLTLERLQEIADVLQVTPGAIVRGRGYNPMVEHTDD